MTAEELVARLDGRIESSLDEVLAARREEVLAELSWPSRLALRLAWSAIQRLVPILARAVLTAILREIGAWTLADVARLFALAQIGAMDQARDRDRDQPAAGSSQ